MEWIWNTPSRTKSKLGCNCRDKNNQHITGNLGKDSISRRIHFPPHQDVKIFHIRVLRRFQQISIQLRFVFYIVLVCQVLLKPIIITFNAIRQWNITNTCPGIPRQWSTTTTRTQNSTLSTYNLFNASRTLELIASPLFFPYDSLN